MFLDFVESEINFIFSHTFKIKIFITVGDNNLNVEHNTELYNFWDLYMFLYEVNFELKHIKIKIEKLVLIDITVWINNKKFFSCK